VRWLQPWSGGERLDAHLRPGALLALLGAASSPILSRIYWSLNHSIGFSRQLTEVLPRGVTGPLVLVAEAGWYLGTKPQLLIDPAGTAPEKGHRAGGCPVGPGRLTAPHVGSRSVAAPLATLLSGLQALHAATTHSDLTVADDGGSSGGAQAGAGGVQPPGDIRNCLAALPGESAAHRLFQYRSSGSGLEGHSFGNLFLTLSPRSPAA